MKRLLLAFVALLFGAFTVAEAYLPYNTSETLRNGGNAFASANDADLLDFNVNGATMWQPSHTFVL